MTLTSAPPHDPIEVDDTKVLFEEARQRRRRRWLVGVCVVVVAAAAIAVPLSVSGGARNHVVGSGSSDPGATKVRLAAPPATSPFVSHVWLSATTVPTSGAQLAASVVNTTGTSINYGVLGFFDRWTGTKWSSRGAWVSSLDQWGGFPAAGGSLKKAIVPLIGLGALPHQFGPVQYFSLPDLPAGWYRVGYRGGGGRPSVYGVIHVTPSATRPVPIANPSGPQLIAYPTIMRTSGEVGLTGYAPSNGTVSSDDVRRFNAALATSVTIQRWNGHEWVFVAVRTVHPSTSHSDAGQPSITLPKLRAGAYRLLRQSPTAGELQRVVWIVPSLPRGSGR